METDVKILTGISDQEKGAYLSAIASIATADAVASQQEVDYLMHLCDAADLSDEQRQVVINAAKDATGESLTGSLDLLKNSDLKFSLLTDLSAFAKSDGNYNEAEQKSVQKIATYLGVNETQLGLLGQLAEKANAGGTAPGNVTDPAFLSSLGDKLQSHGINAGGLLKGLVSIAAPLILSKMMSKNSSANTTSAGGGLGGGLLSGGGLGSLFNMLNGGRGMSSIGGLVGKLLG
jgi:uncharacterized tellurite resistance protein B-like protein